MFRRRKTNEGADRPSRNKSPPPPPPTEQTTSSPLGNNNGPATGMWYKKPTAHTPVATQRHRGEHHHLRQSVGHGPDNNTSSGTPPHPHQYRDNRRSIGHAPDYNTRQATPMPTTKKLLGHGTHHNNTTTTTATATTRGGTNRRKSGSACSLESDPYGDLFELFARGLDWNAARLKIEQDPSCTRQKQTVSILGQRTQAYPLHLAVCTQAPVSGNVFPFLF
jgi:hypothetical protein